MSKEMAFLRDFNKDKKNSGSLKLQRMEAIYDSANGKNSNPHRHEYYTVIWIRKGQGSHLIDFNEYELSEEQVYFVSPGQIHQMKATSRPTGWVFTFHPDFLIESGLDRNFLARINLFRQYSDSPPIELYNVEAVDKVMELLNYYYDTEADFQNEALGAALELFLIECIRQCDPDHMPEDEARSCVLMDFRDAVENNYASLHKVSEYAALLSVSPKHLNEVIKNTIGTNAKDYIIDRLLTESKRLLLHTEDSVKNIAISLGFKEPLHFNSFFKKRTGLTPLQYRKGESKSS
jgi:AraC-like DNA-binding protein